MARKSDFQEKDEVSLKETFLKIRRTFHFLIHKWKIIVICCLVGLLLGLAYAIFSPVKYSATVTFVTDTQNNQNTVSAVSGLAAAMGLNLGATNGSALFSGKNIYDLMKTRRILKNTLLTPVTIDKKKILLIDRYIEMENLREEWQDKPYLKDISFDIDSSKFTLYHHKVISSICKSLIEDNLQFPGGSGSSSLMTVSVISPDELFSELFANNLIENVGKYYVNTTTKKARTTLNILVRQLDSVRGQLYETMANVATFSDKNVGLVRQAPLVSQQKSTLKMEVNSSIYKQLVTAVESARMNLRKETPLFEIVDEPVLPLNKIRHGKVTWSLIGIFVGLFLSCIWLIMVYAYRAVMNEDFVNT